MRDVLEEKKKAYKLNNKKTQGFRNKSYSVVHDSKYVDVKNKFSKPIQSHVYQSYLLS